MTELAKRRRALMAGAGGPIWLYNQGVEAPLSGGFNTTGYKYGASNMYTQSKGATYLVLQALSQYNIRGGRTWTTSQQIAASMVGKTLHCSGTVSNTAGENRSTFVRLYRSENVIDASSTENVDSSEAFVNAQYANFQFSGSTEIVPAGTTKTFDLSLQIAAPGYVSVMFYKGYLGYIVVRIDKIWIE